MQKQYDRRVGEFLRTDRALGIVPSVGKVDDAEQDHRVDLLGAFDDAALGVEPQQEIGDDIDQLPFQVLDGPLFVFVEE